MADISLVVNTACLGGRARTILSSGKQPHGLRAFLLRCFILPHAIADPLIDEVIVVGEFEDGEGYTYVPCPSVHYNAADALAQRQAGFEASTGGVVIFQHDDHLLDWLEFSRSPYSPRAWLQLADYDVMVPSRYTRMRKVAGETLNNGGPEYISGHCAIYRRAVLEMCPWGNVPPVFTWDIEHTQQIRAAGYRVQWTDLFRVWDIEWGATPWQ